MGETGAAGAADRDPATAGEVMAGEALLAVMPHRGRNVLIDAYADDGAGAGRGRLAVAPGDPAGRDLFLVRSPEGLRYPEVFLVEHAALVSVMILREDMGGGRLAFFSTVSRFEGRGTAPAGAPLESRVTRGRDRGEFRSFSARIAVAGGEPFLGVDFMAYLAPRGYRPEARTDRPEAPAVAAEPGLFPCLDPSLAFLGGPERDRGVYPADHPLCEGHFPGAPVMMGMTQWLAVAERASLAVPPGERGEVSGSGSIARLDGRPVVDVAGLRVLAARDPGGRVTDLRILATKRVAFRERIEPGDGYAVAFEPS